MALSNQPGAGTNLNSDTIKEINWGNLGPTAEIAINACNSGWSTESYEAFTQKVADASGKTTYGATNSMSFSGVKGQYIPGPDAVPPPKGNLYMVVDPPGKMERFRPEVHLGGGSRSNKIDNLSGL